MNRAPRPDKTSFIVGFIVLIFKYLLLSVRRRGINIFQCFVDWTDKELRYHLPLSNGTIDCVRFLLRSLLSLERVMVLLSFVLELYFHFNGRGFGGSMGLLEVNSCSSRGLWTNLQQRITSNTVQGRGRTVVLSLNGNGRRKQRNCYLWSVVLWPGSLVACACALGSGAIFFRVNSLHCRSDVTLISPD